MNNSSYRVDWNKKAIIHHDFGKDRNGFGIIEWILDTCRQLKSKFEIEVNVISCSLTVKNGIIKAFSEFSLMHQDSKFIKECHANNAIGLDGNIIYFAEINEDNIIYLSRTGGG